MDIFHSERAVAHAPWTIALTGASGTAYGRRLLQVLADNFPNLVVHLVISEAAKRVLWEEERIAVRRNRNCLEDLLGRDYSQVTLHDHRDIGASIASGTYKTSGMVIVPCSMNTLAAVSCGFSQNLIHRVADVTLKEGRKLIIVPRETPLSSVHLENMLKLSRMGAVILPAMPGFYHQPQSIAALIDMLVMKILDQMGLDVDLVSRWKSQESSATENELVDLFSVIPNAQPKRS